MRRVLFHTLALLSTLALATTLAAWVRSHFALDQWLIAHPRTGGTYVQLSRGVVRVTRIWWPGDWRSGLFTDTPHELETASRTSGVTDLRFDFARISYGKGRVGVDPRNGWVYVADPGAPSWPTSVTTAPLWLPALLFALLPALWLATHRARRRQARLRKGQCPTCAYDLRGSSGACPECGKLQETGKHHGRPTES